MTEKKIYLTVDNGQEVFDLTLKDIVAERIATFHFYRQGYIYYKLQIACQNYAFPIPLEDLGTATLSEKERAITLMRYIRKALDVGTFVRVSK